MNKSVQFTLILIYLFVVVQSHYFVTLLFHLHLSAEKRPKLLFHYVTGPLM